MTEYQIPYSWEQQRKWNRRAEIWDNLSDEQKCVVVSDLYYTPCEYVGKELIYKCFQWLLTGLKMDRLEVNGDLENLRLAENNEEVRNEEHKN